MREHRGSADSGSGPTPFARTGKAARRPFRMDGDDAPPRLLRQGSLDIVGAHRPCAIEHEFDVICGESVPVPPYRGPGREADKQIDRLALHRAFRMVQQAFAGAVRMGDGSIRPHH